MTILSIAPGRTSWSRIETEQHGITDTAQLAQLGVTRSEITAQIEAGRWQWVLPRIYATFSGPLPQEACIEAALRYGGAAAVLSHRTAAEEWGLLPSEDGPIHITVPYGTSAISHLPFVIVHRSRAHAHIVVEARRPLTSRADTALDTAVEEPHARSAQRVLTSLLVTGRVRPTDVERRLVERPPRRYRRALTATLRLIREGVQSVLEECYALDVEERHGLPAGQRQGRVAVDGVTLFEDVVYDHLGVPLTVRLDGRTHILDSVAFRDRRRDNAAELAGRSRLVFGWRDLSRDPCAGAREVAMVLRRRGWSGHLVPCRACIG